MKSESRVPGTREIRGVLLPVGSRSLLLPNAAVAEVIGYQAPESDPSYPSWLLGRLAWRGRTVPLVSFEQALGRPEVDLRVPRLRIAVLNTLNGVPTLPYIAVLSPGIARLARISADNLADDPEGGGDTGLIAAAITLNGEAAWIPDLDVLEGKVLEALA